MALVKASLTFDFGNDFGNDFSELPEQKMFFPNYLSDVLLSFPQIKWKRHCRQIAHKLHTKLTLIHCILHY